MKNMLRQEIKGLLKDAILQAQQESQLAEFDVPEILIEKTQDSKFGDFSTNVALKIAKTIEKPPMEVAKIIASEAENINAESGNMFEKIEAAAPGFVNFFISSEHLIKKIAIILKEKERFGELDIGQNQKIQVEFISANPTGPLTLGNGRGGFYGDTLANLLEKSGYKVEREFFINDAGYQVEVLGHSILGDEKVQYKGEYIEQLREKFKNSLNKSAKEIGYEAAAYIMKIMIKPTIEQRMKIKFNNYFSEKEFRESGAVEKILEFLKEKGVTYEKEGALWFRSSDFGDEKDRVLITSDKIERSGEPTYILPDIAYHYNKFIERKFDKVIDIWAADHHGYVARLQAAKKALEIPGELKILISQMVRLFKDGQEVRMSKRAGTYVTIDELLEEIPLDVARFFFLMYSPDTHMDFNLDLAKEQSEKNPVYYVQYAYARISSILRKSDPNPSADGRIHPNDPNNLKLLNHPAELALIKQLVRLPEIVEDTVNDYQVQRLPQFALELVRSFHKFYEECRVIDEKNPDLTLGRLALVEATRIVLKNTLDLMGISAPEKM